MQGNDLFHQHIAGARAPMRILVGELAAVWRELEDPFRLNPCEGARKELGSFDDFTGDNPRRLVGFGFWRWLAAFEVCFLLGFAARVKRRAREYRKQLVARGFVIVSLFETRHMADQSRENRPMDRSVSGVALVESQRAQIFQRVMQLGINILPFAHPHVGKKALFAEFPPLALRSQPVPFLVNRVPNVEQREKVGLRIGELLVRRGRRFLLFQRTLAGILNTQSGGNDQQFSSGMFVLRLEQHASERGINGQPRQILPEWREGAQFVQRPEFLKQRVPIGDGSRRRRLDKWKRLNVAQVERLHAQDDFREIGALDFRLREQRPGLEILLRVEPDANASLHPARAAFALVGAAL